MARKEYRTQLYFSDDNCFQFIRRELMYSCLVEKANDMLVRAWKHFYGCQLPFPGYKNMSAAQVTLGFARDIILDPFDKVPTGDDATNKPVKARMKDWISNIAENQRHIFRAKRETHSWTNRITAVLLGILVVESILWIILMARARYG